MQSSLRSALLFVVGCLAALAVVVVLPAPTIAAQRADENQSINNRLFLAVQANDLAAVQASIGEGADVEARDRWGMTPTDIAVDRGHYRIAHFLVSVRNSRRVQDAHTTASTSSATQDAILVPAAARKASPPAPSASPAKLDSPPLENRDSVEAWPADAANPFDPASPAPGSQLHSMQRGR